LDPGFVADFQLAHEAVQRVEDPNGTLVDLANNAVGMAISQRHSGPEGIQAACLDALSDGSLVIPASP
jgi:hypothetical protein